MDTLRGQFDPADFSDDLVDFDLALDDEDGAPEPPPSPIGQDERRMQVRAYNHWASLLGDKNYPAIEDLDTDNQPDFGPFSVLLEFTDGIEDPSIRFLGEDLASECDIEGDTAQLSDVPPRSLLTRITDHYMQILANQAPIGFEAEFVNQRETTILYRGILLPFSSDNETIDFIYGVINWKEMADQQTADELMLEIDQALDGEAIDEIEVGDEAIEEDDSKVLDLSGYGDEETAEPAEKPAEDPMPRPSFGSLLTPEGFDDDDDDDPNALLPEGWSLSDPNNVDDDAEYADDSADVYDDDYDPDAADDDSELGLTRLVEEEFERSGREPIDISELGLEDDAIDPDSPALDAHDYAREEFDANYGAQPAVPSEDTEAEDADSQAAEPEIAEPVTDEASGAGELEDEISDLDDPMADIESEVEDAAESALESDAEEFYGSEGVEEADAVEATIDDPEIAQEVEPASFEPITSEPEPIAAAPAEPEITLEPVGEDRDGLYDCLADARELAQSAQSAEDRSRTALYAAVGRAYDVSLAAVDAAEDYNELLEENGLVAQDRAPMTPIVKLVFGTDYDKTRITEYATALTHAHRMGIARGKLGTYLSDYDGGLKGVVNAERRMRREEAGKPVTSADEVRASLANKLRGIDGTDLADIAVKGSEFALVMIHRTEDGDVVVLGEIDEDIPLIERAARIITK